MPRQGSYVSPEKAPHQLMWQLLAVLCLDVVRMVQGFCMGAYESFYWFQIFMQKRYAIQLCLTHKKLIFEFSVLLQKNSPLFYPLFSQKLVSYKMVSYMRDSTVYPTPEAGRAIP